jgi:hypothetical protein
MMLKLGFILKFCSYIERCEEQTMEITTVGDVMRKEVHNERD